MPTETLMMKDSKIGSIKDIPINWEIKKTKYLFDVVNGSTPDSDYYDYWDGAINWITPADMVDFGYVSTGERSITKKGYKSCGTTLVPSNSIVISTRAPIGKINIAKSELCTNQGCKCLVSEKLCNKYFYYLLYSQKEQLIDAGRGTTFIELSTFSLSNFSLILPPLPEQQTIADFLDEKCYKIDKVIGEIEEQIQILEDYKKSLITETVTKGLDKNVPMKDSGIDWIGKIPGNWQIKKIKYLFKVINGSTPDSDYLDYWDGDITWITPADMPDFGYISKGERSITLKGYKSCGTTLVPSNSIVVSSRAPIGKINITEDTLCTNQGCKCLVSNNLCNKYYYYFLYSQKEQLIDAGRGTTFIELSTYSLSNFYALLPPIKIQEQIADYLDKECANIDTTINDKKEQLETIKEYKKSLIYEYVTGKKRVAC